MTPLSKSQQRKMDLQRQDLEREPSSYAGAAIPEHTITQPSSVEHVADEPTTEEANDGGIDLDVGDQAGMHVDTNLIAASTRSCGTSNEAADGALKLNAEIPQLVAAMGEAPHANTDE